MGGARGHIRGFAPPQPTSNKKNHNMGYIIIIMWPKFEKWLVPEVQAQL